MSKIKKYGFWYLEHYDPDNRFYQDGLHYDIDTGVWVTREEYTGSIYPGSLPCRSLRAAKRHLRNHPEIPRGARFILVSKFIGYNIHLTKK